MIKGNWQGEICYVFLSGEWQMRKNVSQASHRQMLQLQALESHLKNGALLAQPGIALWLSNPGAQEVTGSILGLQA